MTEVKAGTPLAALGSVNASPSLTTTTPTYPPLTSGIFSESALQKHIDAVFADVPKEHRFATVGYGAFENGQFVTKFALVGRSADGSWDFAAVAQYASKTGFGAGIYIKKSWA